MPRHPHSSQSVSTLSHDVYSALAAEVSRRSGPVHRLNVGDTYLDPPEVARSEAQRSSDHPRLHNYSAVQGEPALLDAIVAFQKRRRGVSIVRDALQVTAGATGGFAVAATVLMDPGDEVIILAPFWPLIRGIVRSRGAAPVEVPFFHRLGDSDFDPEKAILDAITPRTVAIFVNSPNNPTGRILGRDVQDVVARVARAHGLWVLCDEAYESLAYREVPEPLWMRDDIEDRSIAFHSVSKSHALAGARVGYVHGPNEIMKAVRGTQTFLTYCAARPMQFAAARALDEGDGWMSGARSAYEKAAARTATVLGLTAPQSGIFLFVDAAPYFSPGEDVQGFLRRCLDAGVLLTPGASSGSAYGSWVRLCFTAVTPAELEDALSRLQPVFAARRA